MKKIVLLTLILIVCLSGCKIKTNNSDQTLIQRGDEQPVSSPSPTISPLPTHTPKLDSPYLAYYQKYNELVEKYGKANIIEMNAGDLKEDVGNEFSYLSGVCVVDLMDFNGDGVKDLFVIYSNGNITGHNEAGCSIPQASSYEIEIWTYTDGAMKQLLHESKVSCFSSFRNEFWDEDNCFATVYENAAGRPVIQIYSECFDFNKYNGSISYTNLYYSGDTLVRDKLSYDGKQFVMNGTATTEAVWKKNISEYNKFLLNIYLSDSSWSSTSLFESYGIDYDNTLSQTEHVIDSLLNQKPLEIAIAEKSYNSLYLQVLDRFNRISSDINYFEIPFEYCLYDIDQNGIPELIVLTGACEADYMYDIYTFSNDKLIHLGEISGFHSSLYISSIGGLVNYQGQMGCYTITKITIKKDKLVVNKIAEGEISGDQDYPALEKFGLKDYDKSLDLFYGTDPYLLYAYDVKE